MSMFDVQQQIENEMLSNAKDVANLPLGRAGLYSASVQGDMYNQGLMSLAGLMGGSPDPRIAKEQALQSIFEEYGNPETPEEAVAVADALLAKGFNAEAQQFMNFSVELRNSMPKANKPNASIESFNEAVKGGYTGSYFEWYQLSLKKGDKNISIGSIPQDHIITTDENGNIQMQVIPGSPTDIKAKQAQAGKAEGAEVRNVQKSIVIEDIDRLKTKIIEAPWYNPVAGSILAKFMENPYIGSGGNRIDAGGLATTIKSSIGFDRLQQMRDESPTGGALGQVSELELITLQSTLGSLDLNQSDEALIQNLDRLAIIYENMITKFRAYPNYDKYFGEGTTAAGSSTTNPDPLGIR